MLGQFDMLPTTPGSATPDQIAQVNQLGSLANKGAHRDDHISSPWQGVRMMSDALLGGRAMNASGGAEMAAHGPHSPVVNAEAGALGSDNFINNPMASPMGSGASLGGQSMGMLGAPPPPQMNLPPPPQQAMAQPKPMQSLPGIPFPSIGAGAPQQGAPGMPQVPGMTGMA